MRELHRKCPLALWYFKRSRNSILMCSSSYSLEDDSKGLDLYGNDMSIDAVRLLNEKNTGNTFYLLMIVHNSDKYPHKLKKYQDMIAEGLGQNIMLVTTPVNFLRIMKVSDVILRPTTTDGDSITIREALYLKKRSIAIFIATPAIIQTFAFFFNLIQFMTFMLRKILIHKIAVFLISKRP